ncbi:MAG: hypothetical protein PVJ72_09125 [Gammaproteobacteria bacterium]|jgi:uridylate kinase
MHEQHDIEKKLKEEANRISEQMSGAPVVIIVGGDTEANIPRTMTASSIKGKDVRLRDLLGILQTSIQIESWKHFGRWK